MLCFIYRSSKKEGVYLYVKQRDNFSVVPIELMNSFGKPIFSMRLNLDNHKKLAVINIQALKERLNEQGFYLQVPPPIESLLKVPY